MLYTAGLLRVFSLWNDIHFLLEMIAYSAGVRQFQCQDLNAKGLFNAFFIMRYVKRDAAQFPDMASFDNFTGFIQRILEAGYPLSDPRLQQRIADFHKMCRSSDGVDVFARAVKQCVYLEHDFTCAAASDYVNPFAGFRYFLGRCGLVGVYIYVLVHVCVYVRVVYV